MGTVVARYAVDIGCWDVWENGPLLQKWHDGTLGWHGLWAAQIQHRIVIPRLLIIAMAHLSAGDFRWEQYAAFGMSVLSAILTYRLLRTTFGRSSGWVAGLALVSNLLIFSPMLYQNWFWGSSLWMAIPMPCLLGALGVGQSRCAIGWKVAAMALLGLVATLSFAHGLCLWPVLVCYVALGGQFGSLKKRLAWAAGMAFLSAAIYVAYFQDLTNEAYHAYNLKPGESAMVPAGNRDWNRVFRVFFGFLGSLFARDAWSAAPPLDNAVKIGRLLFAVWAATAATAIGLRRKPGAWSESLPWLALSAYGLGVGAMIAVGRSDIGEFRALTPRYGAVSLFVWIATLVLIFVQGRNLLMHCSTPAWHQRARTLGAMALVAAAAWFWSLWPHGLHLTRVWHFARLQARAHVVFLDQFPPEPQRATYSQLDKSEPRAASRQEAWAYVIKSIHMLRGLGLFHTPALSEPFIDAPPLTVDRKPLAPEKAVVTKTSRSKDGSLRMEGRARFGQDRPADLVVISIAQPDGRQRIVGIGQMKASPALRLYPLDFEFANVDADAFDDTLHRWEARIDAASAPPASSILEVWAFDVRNLTLSRFAESTTAE